MSADEQECEVVLMPATDFDVPKEISEKQLYLLEKAKKSGKVRVGVNECTKAIERGTAKLVLIARDVQPKELTMHLPVLCNEKNIPFSFAEKKKDLGERVGIEVGASAVAITDEGDAKKELADLAKKLKEIMK